VTLAAILALALLAQGLSEDAATVDGPARIVSLAPNMTDILVELGLGDRVVGATRYDRPSIEGRAPEQIGGILDPSVERIVALAPDLVVGHRDGPAPPFVPQLKAAAVEVLLCRIVTMEELRDCVLRVGERTGRAERARALLKRMARLFERAVKPAERRPALLVLNTSPIIVATRSSFPAQVARLAGLEPLPSGQGPDYPRLSYEQVAALAPKLIIDLVHRPGGNDRGLRRHMSVAAPGAAIHRVDPDGLARPGPRLLDGLRALKAIAPRRLSPP
jgi:iron complex transport system substrate-binding protein